MVGVTGIEPLTRRYITYLVAVQNEAIFNEKLSWNKAKHANSDI